MDFAEALQILRDRRSPAGSHVCVSGHHTWWCYTCDERWESDEGFEAAETWWRDHKRTCSPRLEEVEGFFHDDLGEIDEAVEQQHRDEAIARREAKLVAKSQVRPGGAIVLVESGPLI